MSPLPMPAHSLPERRAARIRPWIPASALVLLLACSAGSLRLSTGPARPADMAGTYRLYLYGCRSSADIENMALLVNESSPHRFRLFTLDTAYRVRHGLSGANALDEADRFIRCSIYDTGASVLRTVLDPDGNVAAFELKPLYLWSEMGKDEVLQTDYFLRNGTITVYITLDPQVERIRKYDIPGPDGD